MNKASGAAMLEDSGSEDGSDDNGDEGVNLPYRQGAKLCEQLEKHV